MIRTARFARAFAFAVVTLRAATAIAQTGPLTLNDKQYFEARGLNVFVFTNQYNGMFFDEKTAGIEIIQHGVRIATGGAVRLSPTPEQWDQIPKLVDRKVDHFEIGTIATVACAVMQPPYDTMTLALAGHPPPVIASPALSCNERGWRGSGSGGAGSCWCSRRLLRRSSGWPCATLRRRRPWRSWRRPASRSPPCCDARASRPWRSRSCRRCR